MKTRLFALFVLLVSLATFSSSMAYAQGPTPTPPHGSNAGVLSRKSPLPKLVRRPLAPNIIGITDPTLVPNSQTYDFSADAEYSNPTAFPGGTFNGTGEINVVGSSWNTWNPQTTGIHLLYASANTYDVIFTTPKAGVAVQAEPQQYAVYDVTIEAFDSNNTSLGSFTVSINGYGGAAFLGLLSDSNNIAKVTLTSGDSTGFAFSNLTYGTNNRLAVSSVWTTDGEGNPQTNFNPGDSIIYYGNVANNTGSTANATFSWGLDTPCSSSVLWSGNLDTNPGIVQWDLSTLIPTNACGGSYTYILSVTYNGQTTSQQTTLNVNYSISGQVLNNLGYPIPSVTIADSLGGNTSTDVNGKYMLKGLGAGTHVLTPGLSGFTFSPSSASVNVPSSTTQNFIGNVVLTSCLFGPEVSRDVKASAAVFGDYYVDQLSYDSQLAWDVCPNAPVTFNASQDPSLTINSQYGTTTVSQQGMIIQAPNPSRGRRPPLFWCFAANPAAPSISWCEYWENTAGGDTFDFHLKNDQTISYSRTFSPPKTSPSYLTSLAEFVAFATAVGMVGIAPYVEELLPAILLDPVRAPASKGNYSQRLVNPKTGVNPPSPQVITALNAFFGPDFVNMSTIDTLAVDGTTKHPGDTITITGSNFTPNGSVEVYLTLPNNSKMIVEQTIQADSSGAILGTVQLPASAQAGSWLVAAVDSTEMNNSLRVFASGRSITVHFFLSANGVVVLGKTYLPLIVR